MDGKAPETCAECGFDSRAWRVRDAVSLLGELGDWWRLATAGVEPSALNTRPGPGVWSALEYGLHSALITAIWREGLTRILGQDGVALELPPDLELGDSDTTMVLDPDEIVVMLAREGRELAVLAKGAPRDAWAQMGHLGDSAIQAEAGLFHAVHDATHHMFDVGRGLAAIDAVVSRPAGSVVAINTSGGGVPKRPVPTAHIDWDGVDGDTQADRKHHGRPYQALCLWASEVIETLAAEGHDLAAGRAGENITVAGLDWPALRPGTRLRIGTALAEVSFPTTPCHKQAHWFADGDYKRIDHDRNPHLTRWYAWVREPGDVTTGDTVRVE